MKDHCLACGSEEVDSRYVIYMVNPTMIIPGGGSSYLLCDKHKNVRYDFYDIYDENGHRKKIDHKSVIKRSEENSK